ncbi:MAG: flavin monoamine oxidase family protein [Oceanicaulis sp.]
MLTRRLMLQSGAASGLASTLGPRARSQAGRRVLIAGGGLSGLCAAYELLQRGFDPLVFEAAPRAGGKIRTLREPFDDGLHVEAGALWLFSRLIEDYADRFGLTLIPIDNALMNGPVHIEGVLVDQVPGETRWPDSLGLHAHEHGLSQSEMFARYGGGILSGGPLMQRAFGLDLTDFPYPQLADLDAVSLVRFWRDGGASEGAIRVMSLGYLRQTGEGPERLSALSRVVEAADMMDAAGRLPPFVIEGGNDRLTAAFEAALGERVVLNAPVRAIDQDAGGVRFSVMREGRVAEVRGDYAVCAVPLPMMGRITFASGLSDLRREAIEAIAYDSVTRIFLQYRSRFWEAEGRSPSGTTEALSNALYFSTVAQQASSPRGILESFAGGARARAFDAMGEEGALARALADQSAFHPEAAAHYEKGRVFSWDDEPWQGGHQAFFAPGQLTRYFPALQQAEGRLAFAGEHVAGVPGASHSALAAAHAAVERLGAMAAL